MHQAVRLLASVVVVALMVCLVGVAFPALADKPVQGQSPRIIVGGDNNFPPYEFLDANGQPAGYNVALIEAVADVMGMEIEIRLAPWADVRQALERGEIDVLQGMFYSEERDQLVDFSTPHTIVHHAIFVRRGSDQISALEDLQDKEIIVQNGDIMHDYVTMYDISAQVFPVESPADALRLLAAGEHDCALLAEMQGLFLAREFALTNITTAGPPFYPTKYGFAVREGDTGLLSRLNEGLEIVKATGRYTEIHDQWLGVLESQSSSLGTISKYVGLALIPAFLIVLGSVLWSRSLSRQVAQRTNDLESEITRREQAEEALKEYSERLEEMVEARTKELQEAQEQLVRREKLAVLGQLAGGVGHELRNPLGVISNAVYFLEMTLSNADEATREYMEMISSEVRSATKIISDLLDFARTRPAEGESVVTSELIAQALQKRPPPERVQVATEIASDLPPAYVDPEQMGLVLGNLVINAYQAMPEGGSLTISARLEGDRIAISVADTGCGISEAHMAKLFEPLFTTKARGIGLGLAVSKSLVEANDGSIEVESEVGKGTNFTVRLPLLEGRTDG
jgi:polar amino acid transport system substrate-binding protein